MHKAMKATTLIGGATLLALAGVSIYFLRDGHQGCGVQAKAAVPVFDPFQLQGGVFVQEPWLDPLVFFSDKAYVVEALPSWTEAGGTGAVFIGGADSLVSYLKGGILPQIQPGIGWLKPPVVHFTLNKSGDATDVTLAESSGQAELDARLLQVINDMPHWTPAKNANGGAMEQAFAFRVVQGGCGPPPPEVPERDARTGQLHVSDTTIAQVHPYDLLFTLERSGDNTYTLVTTVKLHGGSFYASPNCTRDLKGKFHVEVEEQGHIRLADKIKELPLATEAVHHHPLVHGPADWVRVDTRYEQRLAVTTREDMEVEGLYRFTIEPRCTMEEIPFVIKQRSGVLTIERVGC
ncbi:MAG: energy transducer TonB [Flavobacteriales bacterium]